MWAAGLTVVPRATSGPTTMVFERVCSTWLPRLVSGLEICSPSASAWPATPRTWSSVPSTIGSSARGSSTAGRSTGGTSIFRQIERWQVDRRSPNDRKLDRCQVDWGQVDGRQVDGRQIDSPLGDLRKIDLGHVDRRQVERWQPGHGQIDRRQIDRRRVEWRQVGWRLLPRRRARRSPPPADGSPDPAGRALHSPGDRWARQRAVRRRVLDPPAAHSMVRWLAAVRRWPARQRQGRRRAPWSPAVLTTIRSRPYCPALRAAARRPTALPLLSGTVMVRPSSVVEAACSTASAGAARASPPRYGRHRRRGRRVSADRCLTF